MLNALYRDEVIMSVKLVMEEKPHVQSTTSTSGIVLSDHVKSQATKNR